MLRRSVLHHVPLLLFLFLLSIYFLPSPSNPFNAKSGQSQRVTKLPNFILQCIGKVPSESISSRRDSQIYSISNLHSVAKLCYDIAMIVHTTYQKLLLDHERTVKTWKKKD